MMPFFTNFSSHTMILSFCCLSQMCLFDGLWQKFSHLAHLPNFAFVFATFTVKFILQFRSSVSSSFMVYSSHSLVINIYNMTRSSFPALFGLHSQPPITIQMFKVLPYLLHTLHKIYIIEIQHCVLCLHLNVE